MDKKIIKKNLPLVVYHLEKSAQYLKELDIEFSNQLKEFQLKIINKFLEKKQK